MIGSHNDTVGSSELSAFKGLILEYSGAHSVVPAHSTSITWGRRRVNPWVSPQTLKQMSVEAQELML